MKLLRTLGMLVLVIILLSPLTLVALLYSPFSATVFNTLAKQFEWPIQVEKLHYQFPNHLKIKGLYFSQSEVSDIDAVELWIDRDQLWQGKLAVDSLLIDGASWQQAQASISWPDAIPLRRLAIAHLDIAHGPWSVRDLQLQIDNPIWQQGQWLPYGEIQLYADQFYWHGQALNHLLVSGQWQPEQSHINGFSFLWNQAKITGQAWQNAQQQWVVDNTTVDSLKLNQKQSESLSKHLLSFAPIAEIKSLNIVNGNISSDQWQTSGLNFAIEHWRPKLPLARQTANIHLQADSLQTAGETLLNPVVQMTLQPEQITIKRMQADWREGKVSLKGHWSQQQLMLSNLQILGVRYRLEDPLSQRTLTELSKQLQGLNGLKVDSLQLKNNQIIQLAQTPFWQVTGLDAQGQHLDFKQQGQWGLWQGKLTLSADNASIERYYSSRPIISMHSDKGDWQLDRLLIPLKQGYLEGQAQVDLAPLSQPWQLSLSGAGLPLSAWRTLTPLPSALHALTDFDLQLSGLAGDTSILSHSLSGHIHAQLHHQYAEMNTTKTPFRSDELSLTLDRGRVTLAPVTLQGPNWQLNWQGSADLTKVSWPRFDYQLQCQLTADCLSQPPSVDDVNKPVQSNYDEQPVNSETQRSLSEN
ncbi:MULTISPECIES: AsmA family protein [unclassified Vibrio]|uniref:AsmA family protein n=1 Tax=Vibrio sp. HB236076 TaxID=3232307 RepID=A0AB39HES5_9VIBR|nr:AsmA family protein [Vibrio sp. HB161653]MDP5255209.1 AsmA family protein [Vibrio sp. HB161653]